MHEVKPGRSAGDAVCAWLRNVTLLCLFLTIMQFLAVISWGATNIPLLALFGLGLAVLLGFLYVAFGIVLGLFLGWIISLARCCKNYVHWVTLE